MRRRKTAWRAIKRVSAKAEAGADPPSQPSEDASPLPPDLRLPAQHQRPQTCGGAGPAAVLCRILAKQRPRLNTRSESFPTGPCVPPSPAQLPHRRDHTVSLSTLLTTHILPRDCRVRGLLSAPATAEAPPATPPEAPWAAPTRRRAGGRDLPSPLREPGAGRAAELRSRGRAGLPAESRTGAGPRRSPGCCLVVV